MNRLCTVPLALAGVLGLLLSCRAAAAPEPLPEPTPPPDAVFLAAGDALLTRVPGRRMREKGYPHLFSRVKDIIEAADAAFLNLETPISTLGSPFPGKPANVTFRADPMAAFALKAAGFDLVSLANNHMNDYGPLAVGETLDYLDLAGLARAGAGRNAAEARRPAIVKAGAWSIGLLSYAQPWWSVTQAGESSAGVAHALRDDVLADIALLKASGLADFIAVSFHWGEEHVLKPDAGQMELGRACVDAGADLVLGHHPHVLQGMERRGRGAIFYSLGNFVFDMDADSTYESLIVRARLGAEGLGRIELLPVQIARASSQPALAEGAVKTKILERVKMLSEGLGTELVEETGVLVSDPPKAEAPRPASP